MDGAYSGRSNFRLHRPAINNNLCRIRGAENIGSSSARHGNFRQRPTSFASGGETMRREGSILGKLSIEFGSGGDGRNRKSAGATSKEPL